jgi:hypothetical protein
LLAALSLGFAAAAPAYDPTAWLLWGREIAHGRLSTAEGPAFKPLPVAIAVLLAPLGSAASWLLVLVARAAALAAIPLAFVVARRAAGDSVLGGALAAVGVLLCGGAVTLSAAGMTEGALIALALGGLEAWRRRLDGVVLACAVAASLLRVEAWPALAAVLVVAWRREWLDRRVLLAIALAVPGAWFVPEALGSGDLLRSGQRARMPEPGQPALADVPFLASLTDAVALVPWPLWAGALFAAVRRPWRRALTPAVLGVAWIILVAAMAQAGFSGESRYALPGAALVAVGGAAGLALAIRSLPGRAMAPAAAAGIALVLFAALPAAREATRVPDRQAYAHALQRDLATLIHEHGRDRLLACGTPYVGRLRGPMLAYALDVPRRDVEPDDPARSPGVVFRSALRRGGTELPAVPAGWTAIGTLGAWELRSSCRETSQAP